MQTISNLLVHGKQEISTYCYQVAQFLYDLIGEPNFFCWMKSSLNPEQLAAAMKSKYYLILFILNPPFLLSPLLVL